MRKSEFVLFWLAASDLLLLSFSLPFEFILLSERGREGELAVSEVA